MAAGLATPASAQLVARVEGRFAIEDETTEAAEGNGTVGETLAYSATFTPSCPEGPCAFTGAFTLFIDQPMTFEQVGHEYVGTTRFDSSEHCTNPIDLVSAEARLAVIELDTFANAALIEGTVRTWSIGFTPNPDGSCSDAQRHLLRAGSIRATRIGDGPQGLVYTFEPVQGPAGTEISFAGSGCPPDATEPDLTFVVANGPGRAQTYESEPDGTFAGTYPVAEPAPGNEGDTFPTFVFCTSISTEFSAGDFTIGAVPGGTPTPTSTPEPSGLAARSHPNRSVFASAIRTPAEVSWALADVARSAVLALILTVLIVFPSELFNATLKGNQERIRAYWKRVLRRSGAPGSHHRLSRGWVAFVLFCILSAALNGFLDPTFGLDRASVVLFLGLLVSLVVVSLTHSLASIVFMRRRGPRPVLEVIPGTLLIGAGCVLVSRLVDFEPGYLYGLIAGFVFGAELSARDEGRSVVAGTLWGLALSLVSWFVWSAVRDSAASPDAGVAVLLVDAVLAAMFSAGLGGAVFSLIPMRFLAGEKLFRWSKTGWAAMFGLSAFAYVQLLLSPASGSTGSSAITVVALFAGFGVFSVAFWAWFRYRPAPALAQLGE